MMIRTLILVALLAMAAVAAEAAEGKWGDGARATVRLIAAGADEGKLVAGIEVAMPAGWHTYWRTPGDAGIPPAFDFSGSTNLENIEVAFPVPTRLDDGVSITNVYNDRVLLPVTATIIDPAAPATLAVAMDLGVCAEICVPDRVTATVDIAPGEGDADARAAIEQARHLLPGASEAGVFAVGSVARDGGTDKRPVFRFSAVVPDPDDAEIFVEGPEHWAAYRPERAMDGSSVVWTVKFSRLGAEVLPADATFRVTIVSGGRAIEQAVTPN
jgi:suppressor for copper-sensitivity B